MDMDLCTLIANIISNTSCAITEHRIEEGMAYLKALLEYFQEKHPEIDLTACIEELPVHLQSVYFAVTDNLIITKRDNE